MTDRHTIQLVSRLLPTPALAGDTDITNINSTIFKYPYFIPARYIKAASEHKNRPYAPETLSAIYAYKGNWILLNEFLQRVNDPVPMQEITIIEAEEATPHPTAEEVLVMAAAEPVAETDIPESIIHEVKEPVIEAEDVTAPTDTIIEEPEVPVTEEPEAETEEIATPTDATITKPEAPVAEEPAITEPEAEQAEATSAEEEVMAEPAEETVAVTGKPTEEVVETPVAETEVKEEEETDIPLTENTITPPIDEGEADNDVVFTPLFAEDYFLQQGIKVSGEIPEADELQREARAAEEREKSLMVMMSFTEWLLHFKSTSEKQKSEVEDQKAIKTMWQKEKLAAALEEENDEIPENVFEMAVNSIAKEEGLASESLADIYIKQKKYDQALEMYRKLSLRNPQKNAYFARKIEEVLKEKQS